MGRLGSIRCRHPQGAWLQQKAHGNRPRTCLALITRSTPMAMAAVRCETLCSFARLITCANECSRMRNSLSVTSDSVHRKACKPCTHSKYETITPPALQRISGITKISYFEWVQGLQAFLWTESEVTDKLFRIMQHSFSQVIKRARQDKVSHRTAAMA